MIWLVAWTSEGLCEMVQCFKADRREAEEAQAMLLREGSIRAAVITAYDIVDALAQVGELVIQEET